MTDSRWELTIVLVMSATSYWLVWQLVAPLLQ